MFQPPRRAVARKRAYRRPVFWPCPHTLIIVFKGSPDSITITPEFHRDPAAIRNSRPAGQRFIAFAEKAAS
jgi:hypothetical protein